MAAGIVKLSMHNASFFFFSFSHSHALILVFTVMDITTSLKEVSCDHEWRGVFSEPFKTADVLILFRAPQHFQKPSLLPDCNFF